MSAACFRFCRLHSLWACRPCQPEARGAGGCRLSRASGRGLAQPRDIARRLAPRAGQGHGLEAAAQKGKHTAVNRSDPGAGRAPAARTARPWGRTAGPSGPRGAGGSSLPLCPFTPVTNDPSLSCPPPFLAPHRQGLREAPPQPWGPQGGPRARSPSNPLRAHAQSPRTGALQRPGAPSPWWVRLEHSAGRRPRSQTLCPAGAWDPAHT